MSFTIHSGAVNRKGNVGVEEVRKEGNSVEDRYAHGK